MKKNITLTIMILGSLFVKAQIPMGGGQPTYDATNDKNMNSLLQQMDRQIQYLDQQNKKTNSVNYFVRDLEGLKVITKYYKKAINSKSAALQYMQKIKSQNGEQMILDLLSGIVGKVEFVQKVLSSNYYQLTDKERMDLIEKEKNEIILKTLSIEKYAKKYNGTSYN